MKVFRSFIRRIAPATLLNFHERRWQQKKRRYEEHIIREFHKLYYPSLIHEAFWLGASALKCPLDCWVYQEIIFKTRPEIIIEAGVRYGGSTLYLASILDLIDHGLILGIDIDLSEVDQRLKKHPRVILIEGSSVAPEILQKVRKVSLGKTTMVILDSDHNASHVLNELNSYQDIVTSGCYMICEDTNLNGNPVFSPVPYNPGPHEAVEEFLKTHSDKWEIDRACEKFMMTCNPGGFLLKK